MKASRGTQTDTSAPYFCPLMDAGLHSVGHTTHGHTHLCSLERHLSRTLLSALTSLPHPRYLWGKAFVLWREKGGGQRSEAREAPPASASWEALGPG